MHIISVHICCNVSIEVFYVLIFTPVHGWQMIAVWFINFEANFVTLQHYLSIIETFLVPNKSSLDAYLSITILNVSD